MPFTRHVLQRLLVVVSVAFLASNAVLKIAAYVAMRQKLGLHRGKIFHSMSAFLLKLNHLPQDLLNGLR